MGISINGPSGIDTASLISQLTDLEMQKVYKIKAQSQSVSKKISAYSQLDTYVHDVSTASKSVDDKEDFNMFNTSSSDSDAVNISTSLGATDGSYGVKVFQLAQREKLISKDGLITDNTVSLSSLGISTGTFEINGVEIAVNDTDTLEDLRERINNTKQADGTALGVKASVLKVSDNDFRFVLTSDDTGSQGAAYKDTSGSVLQDLGIILDANGDKGLTKETFESDTDMNAAWTNLGVGKKITISGTDLNGKEVATSYVKGSGDTIDDFAKFVEDSFHGSVSATIDATTGKLKIEDKNGGNSLLSVTNFNVDGTDNSFTNTVTGYKGSNVLAAGKDAFFSVDNINMSSDKNEASGFVRGVNFTFKSVSYDQDVRLNVNRDYSGIAKKVEGLLNSYNAISRWVDGATKYGDQSKGESVGILVGDMTPRTIQEKIRSVFSENLDITGSASYSSLAQIGIKTNTDTGRYELDKTKFEEALKDNYDEIVSLFVTDGYTDNSSVTFGRKEADTQDGVYNLTEAADGTYSITLDGGDGTSYTATRDGDIIKFDDGPAKGLFLTAPAGSGDATVTISSGLAGKLNAIVDGITDSESGILTAKTNSLNRQVDSYGDQADAMTRRVNAYHDRLVKQFAAMEQAMSNMKAQSTAMMSQLGYYG